MTSFQEKSRGILRPGSLSVNVSGKLCIPEKSKEAGSTAEKVEDRYYSFVGSMRKNRDSSGYYGDGPAISDGTGRRGQKFVQWPETEAWAGQTALENGCFVLIIIL